MKRGSNNITPIFLTVVLCLVAGNSFAHDFNSPEIFDDWVNAPETHQLCYGYYSQPTPPFPNQSAEFLSQQPLTLDADHGAFSLEGNSTLSGHVHLIEGNRELYANKAIIHRSSHKQKKIDHIQAKGNVKLLEPGLRITGSTAEMHLEEQMQIIEHAQYRLYSRHARGQAERVTVKDKQKMILNKATYTTCNPQQNAWVLQATRITLDQETGRGQAYHSRLYLKDVPVFYAPFIDFPIDDRRQTGFLYPLIGTNNQSGVEFGVPIYLNLAPNYDAKITPRLFSKRGLELQGEFRYLFLTAQGTLESAFLPNDRAYRKFQTNKKLFHPKMLNRDPRLTALNTNNNRSALRWHHQGSFSKNWGTTIHYHAVHDDNYFTDFGSTLGIANTTHLLQQVTLNYQETYWTAQALLQQHQTLHAFSAPIVDNLYKRMPSLAFQNNYDLANGLQWKLQGEFTQFQHKKNTLTGDDFTTGSRFHVRPSLMLPIIKPGAYFKPRLQLNIISYSLTPSAADKRQQKPNSPTQVIPMLDIDSGLFFERSLSLQNTAYVQTLEPRLYYLRVPYRNQTQLPNFDSSNPGFSFNQLYWDNRFTGLDRLGDANQLTMGLTTRFFPEKTGVEKLNLGLGQIFYFEKQRVISCSGTDHACLIRELPHPERHHSSLVGTARYLLTDHWTASAMIEWDPNQKQTDQRSVSIRYQPNENTAFNLGYQFLRRNPVKVDPSTGTLERLNQVDTAAIYSLNERWQLLGRWHYDLHKHRSNDLTLGLEQQSCCTAVRLLVSRFMRPFDDTQPSNARQYTNAIYIQFVLKGLGGVGSNKMDQTIKQAFPDYRWKKNRF